MILNHRLTISVFIAGLIFSFLAASLSYFTSEVAEKVIPAQEVEGPPDLLLAGATSYSMQAKASGPLDSAPAERETRRPESHGWFRGFTSDQPYAAILALRAARQTGSYAASRELLLPCAALNAFQHGGSDPLASASRDASYPRRVQAKNRLTAYCSQIPGAVLVTLGDPMADDVDGSKFLAARKTLGSFMVKSKAENRAAFEELARQGFLQAEPGLLTFNAMWKGQSWRDSREIFSAAYEIAAFRASSTPDMAASDIRLQLRCFTSARCENTYESLPGGFSEDMKRKTLSLAAEMEQALRKGDVTPFLAPP